MRRFRERLARGVIFMKGFAVGLALLAILAATDASCLESQAFQLREDYGTEPLYHCYMQYYYYIPCPTYSWFWSLKGWEPGEVIGAWFRVGDPSMYTSHCPPATSCDPQFDQEISVFRVLDFVGYGTLYPGLYAVEFNIWCCDDLGCPVGPALWSSAQMELCNSGWNYIYVNPPVSTSSCNTVPDPPSYPRFLISATMLGSDAAYPEWGLDNVSKPLGLGCQMHDYGCCPALYPRPTVSHYDVMHSGDYGAHFANCPPVWFADPGDPTGSQYGFLELAWRVYLETADPGRFDITGYVRDVATRGVSGVTMALAGGSGGSTTTDTSGYYAFWNLLGGITYTVTPSKIGCGFSPGGRSYPNLSADWLNQNYTADCTAGYEITGYVRNEDGLPIEGVTVNLAGGPGGSATTGSTGQYVFYDLPGGQDYTITPSKEDCYFYPDRRTYTNLGGNQLDQNYKGYCGTAGVPPPGPTLSTWGAIKALFR